MRGQTNTQEDRTAQASPSSPFFSVIMPTWNRGLDVRKAVDSVLQQTYEDFELIIVDDGSDVPAAEALREVRDERVRCVRLDRNRGVAAARNEGIRQAKGEYLAFLDDDDEYLPQKLAVIRDTTAGGYDVVYHRMRIHFVEEGFSYINSPYGYSTFRQLLLKNLLGSPSMVVLRRSACTAVGGFDEILPALEDYELWLRMAKAGFRFKYVDRVLTNYYRHTRRSSRSLLLRSDIQAWELLHEKYRYAYDSLSRDEWAEHLQKIELYRAFRCLLNYRRRSAAAYFLKAFACQPAISMISLLPVAALALVSPGASLALQGRFKRSSMLRALYDPKRAGDPT
jgi:glycosyltransferase involved in cell wall biosynthesis